MVRKINRLWLLIITSSVMGLIIGGTASWVDSHQCLTVANPTSQCLTQDPLLQIIEGMSIGLIAGAGAALGASWQINQKN